MPVWHTLAQMLRQAPSQPRSVQQSMLQLMHRICLRQAELSVA